VVSTRSSSQGLALAVLLSGCGSDDGGAGQVAGGSTVCAADAFAISGTLEGEPVSASGELRGHAFVQGGTPSTFDTEFEGGGRMHMSWSGIVRNGGTTAVTGSITLPPGGARGGFTLNAASGSMTKLEDEVRFDLAGLTESVQCIAPPCPEDLVAGSLAGCAHWAHIGP
jgi:hypothetical protein